MLTQSVVITAIGNWGVGKATGKVATRMRQTWTEITVAMDGHPA